MSILFLLRHKNLCRLGLGVNCEWILSYFNLLRKSGFSRLKYVARHLNFVTFRLFNFFIRPISHSQLKPHQQYQPRCHH